MSESNVSNKSVTVSPETLELMIEQLESENGRCASEIERLISKVAASKNDEFLIRTRKARLNKAKNRQSKRRLAQVTGRVATSLGGSTAVGLAAALAAPASPIIAVSGALLGFLGAIWLNRESKKK